MPALWMTLLVLGLHLAAGWVVYIYILNRLMSRMRGGLPKLALQLALLLFFTGASLGLGWGLARLEVPPSVWRWAYPMAVGAALAYGEARLAWHRWRHAGYPPAVTQPLRPKGVDFLRRPVTTYDLTTVVYDLDWQGPDLKVAHLTDLHLNPALPMAYLRDAIARANAVQPDLVFLSGDFVTHRHEIALLPGLLSELQTTARVSARGIIPGRAIFASLGNHDYWSDPQAIQAVLQELGIILLSGRCHQAALKGQVFHLCADDRPWGQGLEPRSAPGAGEPVPSLVLSHSPDNIYRLVRLPGCAAVFSGHVHGGQIRLPLPWNGKSASLVLPSAYGRRLDHGHFIFSGACGNPVHLFVSAGIGCSEPPLRLYCPPEILIVQFHSF